MQELPSKISLTNEQKRIYKARRFKYRAIEYKKRAARRAANPELYRRPARERSWREVGILNADGSQFTTIDYDRTYQIQQGRCLGCGLHQSELKNRLHADHNHKTGVFRFLLCTNCNTALGLARDNPIILRKLVDLAER